MGKEEEIGYMMYIELAKARSNTSFRLLLASRDFSFRFLIRLVSVSYPFPNDNQSVSMLKLYNAPTIHTSRQGKFQKTEGESPKMELKWLLGAIRVDN